jgi:hypothetical protein
MRERRSEDWVTDLAGRHSLERRMALALAGHPDCVLLKRATSSLQELDYAIAGPGDRLGQVELKAKHQPYRGWGHLRPELAQLDLFILDELALRKIVDAGRYAYLVVADVPGGRWASGRPQSSYWPLRPAQCGPWLQALTAKRPRCYWTCEKQPPG